LAAAGIPCAVSLAPVLPGLTDSEEAIEAVVAAAREHGATSFWWSPLRLAPLVKEHYFGFVEQSFPELVPRYQRAYPGTDAPRQYRDRLEARVQAITARYGFAGDEPADPNPVSNVRPVKQPTPAQHQLAMPL
jgi:DNA repair photolyase